MHRSHTSRSVYSGRLFHRPTGPGDCEATQATGANTLWILFLALSGAEPIHRLCPLMLSPLHDGPSLNKFSLCTDPTASPQPWKNYENRGPGCCENEIGPTINSVWLTKRRCGAAHKHLFALSAPSCTRPREWEADLATRDQQFVPVMEKKKEDFKRKKRKRSQ